MNREHFLHATGRRRERLGYERGAKAAYAASQSSARDGGLRTPSIAEVFRPTARTKERPMPGFLVHQGATVICPHGGQAQPTAPFPRVLLSNQPVTVQTAPYVVAGCGLTGSGSPPCVTAQWVVAATRVMAGGMPVLLQDSQAICAPSGAPLTVVVTQVRVKGM